MDKIKTFFTKTMVDFLKRTEKIVKDFFADNYDSIVKPVVVLLAICIVIPLALAATNLITREKIASLETEQRNAAMQVLFSDAEFSESEDKQYFIAVKDTETVGYVFTNYAKGYGGDVSVMTAVNLDGTIKAVKILDVSNETPGLGQNANKESFYGQFAGMNGSVSINKVNADAENNEITPVTGATITSDAVKNAVNKALEQCAEIVKKGESTNEE